MKSSLAPLALFVAIATPVLDARAVVHKLDSADLEDPLNLGIRVGRLDNE